MIPEQGFTDLRLNRQQGQTDDGFWPSFTDIMTVIVMIFLLAMVILLIRNMELVERLRAAVLAEREAAELARSSGAERETLRRELTGAERELAQLRADKLRLDTLTARQQATIAGQREQLAALTEERRRLQQVLQQRDTELAAARRNREALDTRYRQLQARQQESATALEALQARYQAQGAELADTRRSLGELEQRHAGLQSRSADRAATLEALRQQHRTRETELSTVRRTLDNLERQHAELQTRYDDAHAELERLRQAYAEGETELAGLRDRYDAQAGELNATREVLERVRNRYAATREEVDGLRREQQAHLQLQARHAAAHTEQETLRRKLALAEQALAQALGRLAETDLELSGLKRDYGDLKIKYDDLVKPARSAEGRYLVEVRYAKAGDHPRLSYKLPGDAAFRNVTREQLEARLQALDAGHPEGLYVKVIFPEESGLSYDEAWRFTSELHAKYDYYYRTGGGAQPVTTRAALSRARAAGSKKAPEKAAPAGCNENANKKK